MSLLENVSNLAIFCTLLAKIELTKKLKLAQFCLSHPDTKVSSVAQLCLILCNLMDCSMPGFPVHHQFPELAQTQVHQVGDANHLNLCHPFLPAGFNLSQHQGLFHWVSSSHQVAKVLEFQHQSFQWIFRTDFLYNRLVGSPCRTSDSLKSLLQHHSSKTLTLWHSAFCMVQSSHPCITTGKIIAFLPRNKHLLISCLQSPSA